jgi:hypothetical protein
VAGKERTKKIKKLIGKLILKKWTTRKTITTGENAIVTPKRIILARFFTTLEEALYIE